MQNYVVRGWFNAEDYDAGKPCNCFTNVKASDESAAEDKADREFQRTKGKCAVVSCDSV